MKFKELGLDHEILKAISRSGFEEATPIQAETIPLVLKGDDVIGQAQTGTGKTAAFGLPILEKIDKADRNIQALIISPTRELAIQTQEELYKLGRDKKIKVQAVYGGADIRRQIRSLSEHPQILVGTPGRLLDHINRHTVKLGGLKTLVLDEADEMLDMGFIDDIESIVKTAPVERQTLLFSATMPAPIMRLTKNFMHDPITVKIKSKELTADSIEQYYVRAKDFEKFDVMTRIFDVQAPELALIFGRTKRRVDELTRGLKARGYRAEGIHGDLTQQKRMSVLRQFKSGQLDFLVATDVAARGLDINNVTHVYNYDIPQDPDSYVHRIGRTGRAGKKGVSVTFVSPNEIEYLHTIEELTKKRMLPMKPPTDKEAFLGQISTGLEKVKEQVEEGDTDKYEPMAESLLETYTPLQLVSAYLKAVSPDDASTVPVKITPERPLPSRNKRGGGRSNGGYRGNRSNGGRSNSYQGKRDGGHSNGGRQGGRRDSARGRDNAASSSNRKRNFTIRKNDN